MYSWQVVLQLTKFVMDHYGSDSTIKYKNQNDKLFKELFKIIILMPSFFNYNTVNTLCYIPVSVIQYTLQCSIFRLDYTEW